MILFVVIRRGAYDMEGGVKDGYGELHQSHYFLLLLFKAGGGGLFPLLFNVFKQVAGTVVVNHDQCFQQLPGCRLGGGKIEMTNGYRGVK